MSVTVIKSAMRNTVLWRHLIGFLFDLNLAHG